MENMSIKLSQPKLMCLAVFAAGILVLPIWISAMRKRVGYLSSSAQINSQSKDGTSRTQSTVEKICFGRGAWIYLANLVSGREERLIEGVSPHLSPTGESVVFISIKENEEIMNRVVPPAGRLRVLDLRTKEIRDFKDLRDSRVGDPIWSNDGTKIAVTIGGSDRKGPSIAVLDSGTGDLKKEISGGGIPSDDGIYIDSWTPDDRTLLFHTLSSLYEVHIADALVQKLAVNDLFKLGEISSATRFQFSLDRRYLLFDRIIDTSNEPETEVISLFDFSTKTLLRVTPNGIRGRAPVWLPSNKEILFTRVEWSKDKWRTNICKIALDGTGLITVAYDADFVSYATR
jgi:Tol biopolymer transport system component